MERLTQLIYEDMKPALGVTEPGAIAFRRRICSATQLSRRVSLA